ncbi:DUF1559 family PulG-like putative transporter [Aeoliella mucimassa]|uniref:DUF1559 domain-containing protein n=1 Tax=Aeoliella mucimassa TaxID=2527972 RepID=A0A518ASW1_9BACT|nr:DUF1559 domain-containing protein [Aeoliella mucimassa]QDU57805.1 hypothetical protein Pan181_40280 [Aeoliella mucimassa]
MADTQSSSENPFHSSETGHGHHGRPLWLKALLFFAIVLLPVAVIAVLLLPAGRTGRGVPDAAICAGNVRQISLALINYREVHGVFPPAYTVDEEGNPLHSWRTLILPYLEQMELYDQIDLTKPWDDPVNADARKANVWIYQCPAESSDVSTHTNYVAVVGDDCIFSGSTPCNLAEITDLLSETLLVVEVNNQTIEWMEPRDISLQELLKLPGEGHLPHSRSIHVGYADGSVAQVDTDFASKTLRVMATKAGEEKINE